MFVINASSGLDASLCVSAREYPKPWQPRSTTISTKILPYFEILRTFGYALVCRFVHVVSSLQVL